VATAQDPLVAIRPDQQRGKAAGRDLDAEPAGRQQVRVDGRSAARCSIATARS